VGSGQCGEKMTRGGQVAIGGGISKRRIKICTSPSGSGQLVPSTYLPTYLLVRLGRKNRAGGNFGQRAAWGKKGPEAGHEVRERGWRSQCVLFCQCLFLEEGVRGVMHPLVALAQFLQRTIAAHMVVNRRRSVLP
jgi:hypothetical protein